MAEQKKKTASVKDKKNTNTSKNDSSGSKPNAKGKSSEPIQYNESEAYCGGGMRREVVMLIMGGAAILMFAFLIKGSAEDAGIVGSAIASILLGIFGIGAWILPVALIAGAVYLAMEKSNAIFRIRVFFSALLFLAVLAFVQGLSGADKFEAMGLSAFISYAFRSGSPGNGGLLGALIYIGLYKLVGNVGCYVILILVMIILLMLISGGSFIGCIRAVIGYADSIRDKYADYEEYEEYEEYEPEDELEAEPAEVIEKRPRRRRRRAPEPVLSDKRDENRVLTLDIRKGEKKENKISLITDELEAHDTLQSREKEDDLTGIINLLGSKKASAAKYNSVTEDIPQLNIEPEANAEEESENVEGYLYSAVTEEEKKQEASSQPFGASPEDTPPWDVDEPYSPEEEPEIIKAEKTKLVDRAETEKKRTEYKFPKLEFLGVNKSRSAEKTKDEILKKAKKLEETLAIFKVEARVNNISIGPTVTRYELTPSTGTKVSAVTNLENDIKFSMAAESIIIEAPIPGKSAIGIEMPNDTRESVYFGEVLRSEQFQRFKSKIPFGLGKDITGSVVVADLAKMPHLLVAGTTGSGKSVCINSIIMSILYKATPDEVKMIMVDPKMVELSVYNGIPHLLLPVVTEPEKAAGALNWAVVEMERRYKLLAKTGTRNIEGYNQRVAKEEKLSQIVIIIDELADLMMVVGKEIETSICRLAQKARAAGMHLVLATQRPSADVLTGLIRSNVPSRIAFKVSGSMDSRIILDSTGAEKLLGKGDMLFKTADMAKPMRIQGAFITDDEVERVVNYIGTDEPNYDEGIINEIAKASFTVTEGADGGEDDPMTDEVLDWIVANPKCASAGKVQRHFRIGFNRASRIIEALEERGILGPVNGSQPREVLMDKHELRERKERYDSYDN